MMTASPSIGRKREKENTLNFTRLPNNLHFCLLFFCFFFTRPNVEFAGAKKQQLLFVEITACDGRTEKQQERPWLIALGRGSELG